MVTNTHIAIEAGWRGDASRSRTSSGAKLVLTRLLVLTASLIVLFGPASSLAQPPKDRPAISSRIKREPVESMGLAAIGYSRRLRALDIEFRDGSIYRYAAVPPTLHRQLMASESKARFYNRHVKKKFRSVRVKPRRKR